MSPVIMSAGLNSGKTTLTVTFSEAVTQSAAGTSTFVPLTAADFTMPAGVVITGVSHTADDKNIVVLTITGGNTISATTQLKSIANVSVKDNAGNARAINVNSVFATNSDGTVPTVTATRVNATTVDLVFSEVVTAATANAGAYTVTTVAGADVETLTSAILQPDGITVRLVFTGATIAAGDTITVPGTIADPAGNTVVGRSIILAN